MKQKLVLIDGHSILNRAFYGVPMLTNAQGQHTNAIYGFLNIMFKILEEEKPDYLAVAFDVHAKTFRHEMFEQYKGTRKPMPEELREQVPMMKEVLQAMQVEIKEQAGLEADDILGTLAKKGEADGLAVVLVSGDRDLLQIATDEIKIRIPKTSMGKTEIKDYYAKDVLAEKQVTPLQFIDLKALMGDTADNIPGVPKVGEKTATDLMVQFGSLENIYEHLEEISKKSIRESLAANRDLADLSKKLATIKIDCDIALDYEKAKAEGYYTKEAYQMFKNLEFKNMLSRFDAKEVSKQSDISQGFHLVEDLESFKKCLQQTNSKVIGLYPAVEKGTLLGIAVSFSKEDTIFFYQGEAKNKEQSDAQLSFFASDDGMLNMTNAKETEDMSADMELKKEIQKFSMICSQKESVLSTFDIKQQYEYLQTQNIAGYFDVLIGAYLINPLKNDYDIATIANEHLDLVIPDHGEVFGKKTISQLFGENQKAVVDYFCYCAYVVAQSYDVITAKLKDYGMLSLMNDIEMPLSLVLYDMEKEGVFVERQELKAYGDALVSRISELEAKIHEEAGESFNILSPKQLGEVLFEKMGLPGGKKTKTGYSTAADVLEKLSGEYPIVKDILEYRGLTKLKSTYADGLANYIKEDGRIHTSFNQTITATGRISSTEPNLQNIPMRMELGRQIRKVFLPADGCVFLDADYSQIELRVLAHMSEDAQLIEAYHTNQDIHRITAAKVFHVPFEEVTDLQRRNAKAVNFGIVYGISAFGLSEDLSISKKEADEYIKEYFRTYPRVKEFIDGLVESTRSHGYCESMFGRRRPVPEIGASNFMQRSFGERIAMNSPIQGTAADIMKIAMIQVWKALKEGGFKSKLILQVHDELIIETRKEEENQVKEILISCMENAAKLSVPLVVDVHSGNTWYEAK